MIIFDKKKDAWLRSERNISFEYFAYVIEREGYLDVIINPAYDGQKIFIIEYNGYTYAVPFEYDRDENIILKTVYPSRRYHNIYRNKP